MISYTPTCDPDCQLTSCIPFKNDFWASEASNMMGSLWLGGIFNHTEAVYYVEIDHCRSSSSQEPQRHAVLLLTGETLSASRKTP